MRTREEISKRLDELIDSRELFHGAQLNLINAEILRLQWVLGEGPDIVIVPTSVIHGRPDE